MSTIEPRSADDKAYLWKYAFLISAVVGGVSVFKQLSDWWSAASGPQIIAAGITNEFSIPPSLQKAVSSNNSVSGIGDFKGYVSATIRNAGDLPATDTRLQMRANGTAMIRWDDGKTEEAEFTNDINLGDLPIEKTVSLSIWTTQLVSLSENPPLVIHSTGQTPLKRNLVLFGRWESYAVVGLMAAGAIGTILGVTTVLKMAIDKVIARSPTFTPPTSH